MEARLISNQKERKTLVCQAVGKSRLSYSNVYSSHVLILNKGRGEERGRKGMEGGGKGLGRRG
jgi:hypothetical protein